MAAPTTSVRVNPSPTTFPFTDGFSTKISPNADPDVSFWERTVTPISYDTEEKIPLTNMFNALYRTFAGRKLLTVGDVKITAFWCADSYDDIRALMGGENAGSWTVTFPDGSKVDFYGFVKSFVAKDFEEGKAPEADIEIVITNYDPSGKVEQGPVITASSGT